MVSFLIPFESALGETRVSATPETVKKFLDLGCKVFFEKGAGKAAGFLDDTYMDAGAELVEIENDEVKKIVDIVLCVQPPNEKFLSHLKPGSFLVGLLNPYGNKLLAETLKSKNISAIALELLPRISRAQSSDALSSQANIAGYKSVLLAASALDRYFPMLMTAAGTIQPSKIVVLGAGVAGLQAIATAKRLGARVDAFDTRDVVEEQVQSLGAKFVKIDLGETGQTDQGYAKELTPEQVQKQKDLQSDVCARSDIVITTAQLFGRPAPKLIDAATIEKMKPGSVIFDMAVESGGNVEGSVADEVVIKNDVKIIGISNLASSVSNHASLALSNNFNHWITDFFNKEDSSINFDFDDEIIKSSVIVFNGKILNERFK